MLWSLPYVMLINELINSAFRLLTMYPIDIDLLKSFEGAYYINLCPWVTLFPVQFFGCYSIFLEWCFQSYWHPLLPGWVLFVGKGYWCMSGSVDSFIWTGRWARSFIGFREKWKICLQSFLGTEMDTTLSLYKLPMGKLKEFWLCLCAAELQHTWWNWFR